MKTEHAAADRCPRCGVGFACGASAPGPCACTSLQLSAALQLRLRQQFNGCLCQACLIALNAAEQAAILASPSG